jgi:ElaB/YqjD/DUF883 family membrane-anchored ribosome-binding protein
MLKEIEKLRIEIDSLIKKAYDQRHQHAAKHLTEAKDALGFAKAYLEHGPARKRTDAEILKDELIGKD